MPGAAAIFDVDGTLLGRGSAERHFLSRALRARLLGPLELLAGAGWVFKAHMFLGMTLFLVFPFTRLVHVWSGFGTLAYLVRPYQVVRTRRALQAERGAR